MSCYNGMSEKAADYIERAKKTGSENGDSPALSELCRQAYADYQAGVISEREYQRIYTICVDYAYPR